MSEFMDLFRDLPLRTELTASNVKWDMRGFPEYEAEVFLTCLSAMFGNMIYKLISVTSCAGGVIRV